MTSKKCEGKNPPWYCGLKRKAKKRKMDCSCPAGFTRTGIMCRKGKTVKRATCRKKTKR